MKTIIIDDEITARVIIRQLLTEMPDITVEAEFSSAIDAIKYLNEGHPVDLIFLDIHMPSFTGFDFLKTIKEMPNVILVTSDANFALDAFAFEAIIDYIVKPIDHDRFKKAVDKARKKRRVAESEVQASSAEDNELYINIDRRLIKLHIPGILLVEAKGDYIQIKTESKNYTVHSTLKKIEDKLPSDTFLRVHRSFIINVKKIIDIEDNSVLIDRHVIPVSRSNRPELMRRLNLL